MLYSSAARAVGACLFVAATTLAVPTWPDKNDEFEQIMYVSAGYARRGFLDFISPCSFSDVGKGRINAAEWIRTAYHDMATADVDAGTGGLDASLMFETERDENVGDAVNHTFGFLASFHCSQVSVADLLALTVQAAVKMCKGPLLPVRTGRVDATEAGPYGVPKPHENITALTEKFVRQGFNTSEMIELVACGHTIGGVHGVDFPTIVPDAGNAGFNISRFDSTTQFDNAVATEYINGNTTNPLVVGPDPTMHSDKVVFSADGNVTIKALTDPDVFQERCASVMTKMIETVPAGIVLSEPILPYEVKPNLISLELSNDGSNLTFTGHIRVRTTVRPAAQIKNVTLLYTDLDGGCGTIATKMATFSGGSSTGLTDNFMNYEISTVIPASTAIKSFNVSITNTNGTVETYDNNGVGFPVSSPIFLSSTRSCKRTNEPYSMTVAAAVREDYTADDVQLVYSVPFNRQGVIIPLIKTETTAMTFNSTVGPYDIYTVTVPLISGQVIEATFDLVAGDNMDYFRNAAKFPECK
ncbi:hypothetical protein PZA11_001898 [Diplocarpon coronariae]|uniref:Peroxidase n=1 Tax=Diplocarpon coronariae TaxID=2795749 RepID=A0A218Z6A2_9HELO|nr:L-ascorbate oxidase [Marssonina coronariae]